MQNTYAQTVRSNRFIANDIQLKPTKVPVDVKAGFVGHPTKELTIQFGAGYQLIQDQMFFVNEFLLPNVPLASGLYDANKGYSNRFQAEYDDNNVLNFHGEINYNSYKKWSANLQADYFSYSLKTLPEAWNMPEFKITANGRYRITDEITATASFLFLPKRVVKVSEAGATDELPVVYDLTLGGEYQYTQRLSFFLEINNALASKYYTYNGYPSQRFNAVAGAIFKF